MICPRCGKVIPDGAQCHCSGVAMFSSNPAVNILKSVGASTMFLALAILQTVSIALTVIGSVTNANNVMNYVYSNLNEWGYMMEDFYYNPSMFSGSNIVGSVIGAVFPILTVVALWLFRSASKNISDGGVSTTGIRMIIVIKTIQIVLISILFVFIAIVFIIAAIGIGASSSFVDNAYAYGIDSSYMSVAFIISAVIFAAMLAPVIIYYISFIRTLKRIKATAETGIPDNRISSFVIVILYILAGFSIIGGLTSLTMGVLSAVAMLVSAAAYIVTALCLSSYKKQMTALIYNPPMQTYPQGTPYQMAQPPYGAPTVEPQNPYVPPHTQNVQMPQTQVPPTVPADPTVAIPADQQAEKQPWEQ